MTPCEYPRTIRQGRRPRSQGAVLAKRPDVLGQLGGRGVPVLAVLGQGPEHDPVEPTA